MLLCTRGASKGAVPAAGAHHVEGNHIAKGYFSSLVPLDQMLVYQNRAATGRQAQNKRLLRRGLEGIDAFLCLTVSGRMNKCKGLQYAPIMYSAMYLDAFAASSRMISLLQTVSGHVSCSR
jgi:uncharacterized membrane protein